MNTVRLRQLGSFLLLIISLFGCLDHRIPVTPGANRLRVKTITQEGPNGTTRVSAFKYDGQGRLSLIIGYQAPDSSTTPIENTVFQYDGQNRLTQARREVVRRSGSSPNPFELYSYGYNGDGLVAGVGFTSSSMGAVTRWNAGPIYNGSNRPVGSSGFFDIPGVTITNSSSYTYTGNNITFVSATSTLFRNVAATTTSTITYAYDTSVNPFYGVFVIPKPTMFAFPPSANLNDNTYFGGLSFFSTLNQNNILSATNNGGGITLYSYTYNAANLPTKRVTASGNSVLETLYFEYESY